MSHNLQYYISFFIQALRRKAGTITKTEKKKKKTPKGLFCTCLLNFYDQALSWGLHPHDLIISLRPCLLIQSIWGLHFT